ncbi:hypothetical protein SDC9_163152 [bioreactor metagenome]|uniref:ABC transporter Uup C-terminal domain-containing protein n=1 Tax=bioreactor metagenome TaxID=1076179 RepID=A0A645FQ51_9ZZZZ
MTILDLCYELEEEKRKEKAMNAARRKKIDNLIERFELLKEEVDTLMEEESAAYENLSENLQESVRGQSMQEAVDNLNNAGSSIEEVTGYLESAKGE